MELEGTGSYAQQVPPSIGMAMEFQPNLALQLTPMILTTCLWMVQNNVPEAALILWALKTGAI